MHEFDDNQFYSYPPHVHPPYHHVPYPPFNNWGPYPQNLVVPIVSTIGAGPKGDQGPAGVLKFGREGENTVEWDNRAPYDIGTFVIHDGVSYVSVRDVPTGIEIGDQRYWMRVGNENVLDESLEQMIEAEEAARQTADQGLADSITAESNARIAADNALDDDIEAEAATRASEDSDIRAALSEEIAARIAGDQQHQDLSNYYTKDEAEDLFVKKGVKPDDILVCIGDDALLGYSPEHTNGITGWDTYLGNTLGYTAANVFKAGSNGAGFSSGAKFTSLVSNAKASVLNASKDPNDVADVVIGGGVNDLRGGVSSSAINADTVLLLDAVLTNFPKAKIHIFPMLIGIRGCSSKMFSLIKGINDACCLSSVTDSRRVAVYKDCWTWNYDGNDSGVSSDMFHLLENGIKRVAASMAIEINGGDASNNYAEFSIISPADGTTVLSSGRRIGSTIEFNFSSLIGSVFSGTHSVNCVMYLDPRYGSLENNQWPGLVTLFRQGDNKVIPLFYHSSGHWCSYEAIDTSYAMQGHINYRIEAEI